MEGTIDFFAYVARLCATRECCASDIRKKLHAKGANPSEIDDIVNHLQEEGYLDERRYARAFVSDKFRFAGWGRVKIAYELRLKGITESVADEALGVIDEEAYEKLAIAFLKSKLRTTKAPDSYTLRQKVVQSAARRGYEPTLAFRLVEKIEKGEEE